MQKNFHVQVAPQYPRLQQAFQTIIETTVPEMAESLQPELDQLFDKEKNPFTENQVRFAVRVLCEILFKLETEKEHAVM